MLCSTQSKPDWLLGKLGWGWGTRGQCSQDRLKDYINSQGGSVCSEAGMVHMGQDLGGRVDLAN